MIKPPKIFLYYFVIAIVLVGLSFFIPPEGIKLGASSLTIKWVTIDDIVETFYKKEYQTASSPRMDSLVAQQPDSISVIPDLLARAATKVDSINLALQADSIKIEYPASFKKLLHNFYAQLAVASDSRNLVRILHIGDSQIEGDRITRFLRELLQKRFGGCGPGLIPVYDPQKQFPSVWINNTGKWKEHTVYHYPREIKGNQYGIIGKVAKIDSMASSSVTLSKSYLAQPQASRYYKTRLFLKSIEKPLLVSSYFEGQLISKDSLLKDEGITEMNWTFKSSPKQFSLDFKSDESPIFLGLSLDSLSGVAVDNISMRGQSTPRLDKTDTLLYKTMASYMNIGMVVLQFGTNMAPTITSNYDFYSYTFYNQLKIIKEMMPNIPVVVVGVGDVATITDGKALSYSHIYKIKEAQKAAAFKAGFAFFDLYKTMGGEGSMLEWVSADPRLAMSDYTHFNKEGGKKVANWLYQAILHDYNNLK